VIPGPTAFVLGLIQSGMSTERFAFEGFLDRKKSLKEEQLEKIKSDNRTLVFYESPHRLKKTLKSMLKVLGNRKISISREITKKFEEVIRLHLSEALDYYEENDPRGEYVLTVEGNLEEEIIEYNMPIKDHIIAVMAEGKSKKEAIKSVAKLRNINKNVVYKESFDIALKD